MTLLLVNLFMRVQPIYIPIPSRQKHKINCRGHRTEKPQNSFLIKTSANFSDSIYLMWFFKVNSLTLNQWKVNWCWYHVFGAQLIWNYITNYNNRNIGYIRFLFGPDDRGFCRHPPESPEDWFLRLCMKHTVAWASLHNKRREYPVRMGRWLIR